LLLVGYDLLACLYIWWMSSNINIVFGKGLGYFVRITSKIERIHKTMIQSTACVEDICQEFFAALADQFPIVSASDEFFYFPQVKPQRRNWSRWDTFSESAIDRFAHKLLEYENILDSIKSRHENPALQDLEKQIDRSFLKQTITTLREQLTEVRTWEKQPTFHLTIACLGVAEALESDDPSAASARVETLPCFIDTARHSLKQMPTLYRDLGLTMLASTKQYLISLVPRLPGVKASLPSLDALENFLHKAKTQPEFRMPGSLVEKIIRQHLGCRHDISKIQSILDSEIHDMQTLLNKHATVIAKDMTWEMVLDKIPFPTVPSGGLVAMYDDQVRQLAKHCLALGLLSEETLIDCPVNVRPVPSFLSTIRTASSYSVQPDHPPNGGIFYVINADKPEEAHKAYQKEFRILSAHETYPGHHFLDSNRLCLSQALRRCIEKPIFYEGWACFAEKLMQLTGYFDSVHDKILLARRRLWRAMRGKVDLGLQTGTLDFPEAIEYLMKTGINERDAAAVVRKYPLNPGYQLCYTLGFQRFSTLYKTYGQDNLKGFVKCAVSHGEIDFKDLERILALIAFGSNSPRLAASRHSGESRARSEALALSRI